MTRSRLAKWRTSTKTLLTACLVGASCLQGGVASSAEQAPRALVDLGRALFFDARLSRDGKVSCATCHVPARAFQDGRPTAHGTLDQAGTRNTPSLLHVGLQRSLFWDGRRLTLDAQALDPMLNAREHGPESQEALMTTIAALPEYAALFDAANAGSGAGRPRFNPSMSYVASLPFMLRPDGSLSGGDDASALNALLSKVVND